MLKRIILLVAKLVIILPLIFLSNAFAKTSSAAAEIPIEIHSDTVEFNDKKGTAVYRGHVKMEQGNHQVLSDNLLILKDKNGKIESLLASGNPAEFITQTAGTQSATTGNAKKIAYFPKSNQIHLEIDASISQNGDTIIGDYLIYDLNSRVLNSTPIPGKKTKIFLTTKEP